MKIGKYKIVKDEYNEDEICITNIRDRKNYTVCMTKKWWVRYFIRNKVLYYIEWIIGPVWCYLMGHTFSSPEDVCWEYEICDFCHREVKT